MEVKSNFFRYISTLGKILDDPYNHPQPSICHKTMAVKWHSELSRWHAPPHRQFTFSPSPTALHIRNSLTCKKDLSYIWWWASAAAPQTVVPPP